VSSVVPVLLLAFGGFLFGGAYSLYAQDKSRLLAAVLVVLGVLAIVAGILYL
jgi:hypothetical protein